MKRGHSFNEHNFGNLNQMVKSPSNSQMECLLEILSIEEQGIFQVFHITSSFYVGIFKARRVPSSCSCTLRHVSQIGAFIIWKGSSKLSKLVSLSYHKLIHSFKGITGLSSSTQGQSFFSSPFYGLH
ncbi:hypothetical protein CDL12_24044 [Handroanthus impetiginosus]|uniref:Uncharacterized protein n=1 Tax=Handroanthus impetiginosus TaxID=429701 RepID=A0A2G9GDR7_9LAMI|nr:hypothetical protein CDL12_24044 [Handroanthus impetiginosus]